MIRTYSFGEAAFSQSEPINCIFFLISSEPCTWTHYWNQESENFANVLFKVIDLTKQDSSIFVIGHINKILTPSKLNTINISENVALKFYLSGGAPESKFSSK